MSVSGPIRLLALAALLGALTMAGGMLFLGRTHGDAAASVAPPPVVRTEASAPVRPKPKLRNPVVAANGLPRAIAAQLLAHEIVVAAVYARGAAVDRLARDEAKAGARDAGAGFAAVDVADGRAALALAEETELLTTPAVLVFAKGGDVRGRLDGFVDRQLVAALAAAAR